jgi:AcrR family transcriptional regulator
MSPRAREQNEKMRAESLARINSAALTVFARYGYHGATIRRIARAAGLSYGLVYHYFPSKAKVFRRLVDFALGGSLEAMRQFMNAPGTAWQRIETYTAMVVKSLFEGETSLYFIIILQAMTQGKTIPGLAAHLTACFESFYKVFVPVIAKAQRDGEGAPGDPEALAGAFFSFVQGLATIALQRNGLEKKITPDMLARVLRRTEIAS